MFDLYFVDDYHAIGQFSDKEGNLSWQLITTNAPIVNNIIDGDVGFEMEEINPNDFELNGQRRCLIIGSVEQKYHT